MLTNILVTFRPTSQILFELCMNKLKIANLYYYKSRAITLTKLKKKSTCKVPGA
jgi:hypothetical protein